MSNPVLKIRNHHALVSGDPPIIDDSKPEQYIGYFENLFGEQWIFTCDRATGKATLRGGDIGWNKAIDVSDGSPGDLALNATEAQWLECCLAASRTVASS
ncbi:MAG: hypothetical protein ACK5GJ_00340 [Planctomycetota bacterium]